MKTELTTLIAEFAKANKVSKIKTTEFIETVLAQHTVKKEKTVREKVKNERVIDRIYNLAANFQTFNVGQAAELTNSSWIASYHAIKHLAKEGKIKEVSKQETGKRGKKSAIWSIA